MDLKKLSAALERVNQQDDFSKITGSDNRNSILAQQHAKVRQELSTTQEKAELERPKSRKSSESSKLNFVSKESDISSKSNLKSHKRIPFGESHTQVLDASTDPKGIERKQTNFNDRIRQEQYKTQNIEMLKPRSEQLITVIQSKFYQDMHNVCMAAKYKVHAPLCQCTAIQNLMRNKLTFHDKATTPLQIEDSLIVVPKIRTISVIYSGLDTSYQDFRKDPLEMEAKLLREIQDSVTEDSLSHAEIRTNLPPVEIQGAECLLAINPNAFACISANNYESVCKIQAWSRDAQQVALEQGQTLMKDHADFMGVFVWEDLLEFYKACESKDEERSREASHKLAEQLSQQDIQLASEMLDIPCFKMGHHLQTILRASSSKLRDFGDYWLTMVSKTQAGRFELDLPGGKRHLGESTWDGLVRESQEETSLRLDSSWIMEDRQPLKTTSERVNIYYQLWPPSLPFE